MSGSMRGLTTFISDIRACSSKQSESIRVEKELLNIRQNFNNKNIDSYSLRKYTYKILYIHMLGYEINISHIQILQLISSNKYNDKLCGYLAMQLLSNIENNELLKLMIQSIKNDLLPHNDTIQSECTQCIALHFIANIQCHEYCSALSSDVVKILLSGQTRSFVRKKACLALLQLIRQDYLCLEQSTQFVSKLLSLLDDPNLGVVNSCISLITGLCTINNTYFRDVQCINRIIILLSKLSFSKQNKSIYRYYLTLNPWLQIKLLHLLRYFDVPSDRNILSRLYHILNDILTKTQITKNINKNNSDYSILYETLYLIIDYHKKLLLTNSNHHHHQIHGEIIELTNTSINLLGQFITIKESNFRYLSLDCMIQFLSIESTHLQLNDMIDNIALNLNDNDISICKRAIELLYRLCNIDNVQLIITKFTELLQTTVNELKNELVIKLVILAEKYYVSNDTYDNNNTGQQSNIIRYIDLIYDIVEHACDSMNDDIWYHFIHIVTSAHEPIHQYILYRSYYTLINNITKLHEIGVKLCCYCIGEFNDQLIQNTKQLLINTDSYHIQHEYIELMQHNGITANDLYTIMTKYYTLVSSSTKSLILTSYMKLCNTYDELRVHVTNKLQQQYDTIDIELQQRCIEYLSLLDRNTILDTVFDIMPNWYNNNNQETSNILLKHVKQNTRHNIVDQQLVEYVKNEIEQKQLDEQQNNHPEQSQSSISAEYSDDSIDGEDQDQGNNRQLVPVTNTSIDLLGLSLHDNNNHTVSNNTAVVISSTDPHQHSPTAVKQLGAYSGLLYDNSVLQIGYKVTSGNNESIVTYTIYIGNKSMNNTIDSFNITYQSIPSYSIQHNNTLPVNITYKTQLPLVYMIESIRPTSSIQFDITVTLTYNNTVQTLNLILPISMLHYISPTQMTLKQYNNVYQKYQNELSFTTHQLQYNTVDTIKHGLSSRCHLAVIDNSESISDEYITELYGTGIYHTSTIHVPCIIKLQLHYSDNNIIVAINCIVHTQYMSVTQPLLQLLKLILQQ